MQATSAGSPPPTPRPCLTLRVGLPGPMELAREDGRTHGRLQLEAPLRSVGWRFGNPLRHLGLDEKELPWGWASASPESGAWIPVSSVYLRVPVPQKELLGDGVCLRARLSAAAPTEHSREASFPPLRWPCCPVGLLSRGRLPRPSAASHPVSLKPGRPATRGDLQSSVSSKVGGFLCEAGCARRINPLA